MDIRRKFVCTIWGALLSAHFLVAPANADTISVKITGVEDRKGRIMCGLYATAKSFPLGTRLQDKFSKISNGTSSCTFNNVKPGTYAIAVIHDENFNNIMDTNVLRIPKEGFGFSRNIKPRFGLPKFDRAAINVPKNGTSINIKMQYL